MSSMGWGPDELLLEDVELIDNHARRAGGGLLIMPAGHGPSSLTPTAELRRCKVLGNSAQIGGAAAIADLDQLILEVGAPSRSKLARPDDTQTVQTLWIACV